MTESAESTATIEQESTSCSDSPTFYHVMCSGDIVKLKQKTTNKRRFFVLRYSTRQSSLSSGLLFDESAHSSVYYRLEYYASKKKYQRGAEAKVFDMNRIIHVSRCAWKGQKHALAVYLEHDALFLKFDSEKEMDLWRKNFMQIFNTCHKSNWPSLIHCFDVIVKKQDLAAMLDLGHNGRKDSLQCRLCLTKKSVLVVTSSLSKPNVTLPFGCIRRCVYSLNVVQLHLGRLSPTGEGELHFQANDENEAKEVHDELILLMKDFCDTDTAKPTSLHYHRGPRHSRGRLLPSNSESDSFHYQYEFECSVSSGNFDNGVQIRKMAVNHRSNSLYINGSRCSHGNGNSYHSAVLEPSSLEYSSQGDLVARASSDDDYCQMDFPVQRNSVSSNRSSVGCLYNSRSHHSPDNGTPNSSNPGLSDNEMTSSSVGVSNSVSEESRLDRLSLNSYHNGELPFGGRTFSLGSRPLRTEESSNQDRQISVELGLAMRPRTTSDATQGFRPALLRQFRPRASSHGTKNRPGQVLEPSQHSQQSIPEMKEGSGDDPYVSMSMPARPPADHSTPHPFAPCSICKGIEQDYDPYSLLPAPAANHDDGYAEMTFRRTHPQVRT